MRILQVNKLYPPVVGGIEQVVRQLAEGFSERGHESRVLVATDQGRGTTETSDGVQVRRVSSLGQVLSTPLSPTFPAHVASAARKAEVVHYHLPNPLAVVSHCLLRPSTPTVLTYHSDIVRQSRVLKLYRPLLERTLADVDRIITTSPRLRDSSPFLQPHTDKTTIVPIGIDVADADSSGTDVDVPGRTDRPVVLTVGRVNYYKGVEYFVRAASEIDVEATFIVVGEGPRRQSLERLANSLGVEDTVTFSGWVDDETLAACYQEADLFVLPSVERSEAFGIVQLEAMARGVPVVNTALSTGVPWVSRDGETGLTVPPGDVEALADVVTELLSNEKRRAQLSTHARKRVIKQFSESKMIEDTFDVYQTVTN